MRIALGLSYNGSGFDGWQSQPSGRTVQDALERALAAIAAHPVSVITAGRTDAGVHATGQVVHFDAASERVETAWVRGVNSHLPDSIAVHWATTVADDFHARFVATSRTYRYVLYADPVRPALLAGQVGWFHRPLDVSAMRDACSALLGQHDFSSFRASACQAKTPVRTLRRADLAVIGRYIIIDFEADAFLQHMIRNIVGALIYVGQGKFPAAWMAELLARRDRRLAPPTFSPTGLYLTNVYYDKQWQIPLRTAPLPLQGEGGEHPARLAMHLDTDFAIRANAN